NKAIRLLRQHGHEVVAVGRDKGEVAGVGIQADFPENGSIDTVTLYLNPEKQKLYYDKILSAHPRRIIFNPGTENPEFEKMARQKGIVTEEACTLVLLNTGQYE
ncbi:MAG TPA: CoA-binding protein, partial [Chitinophagales bacterium]|nr:CoA-binding protein [Chitinophagales bacterium]